MERCSMTRSRMLQQGDVDVAFLVALYAAVAGTIQPSQSVAYPRCQAHSPCQTQSLMWPSASLPPVVARLISLLTQGVLQEKDQGITAWSNQWALSCIETKQLDHLLPSRSFPASNWLPTTLSHHPSGIATGPWKYMQTGADAASLVQDNSVRRERERKSLYTILHVYTHTTRVTSSMILAYTPANSRDTGFCAAKTLSTAACALSYKSLLKSFFHLRIG